MRNSFSLRNKLIPENLQTGFLDNYTRNNLFMIFYDLYLDPGQYETAIYTGHYNYIILKKVWTDFLGYKITTLPSSYIIYSKNIESFFDSSDWNGIFDFIEYLINEAKDISHKNDLSYLFNEILEKENTIYRVINGCIIEMTSEVELSEINTALEINDKYLNSKKHIQNSIGLLSNRENPDFRNSIKESISAVEALCRIIINDNKATLGEALKLIEKNNKIHKSLLKAFSAIYGYTSDGDAIRHSFTDESEEINKEDAIYFLVTCSAFINYLIVKFEKN